MEESENKWVKQKVCQMVISTVGKIKMERNREWVYVEWFAILNKMSRELITKKSIFEQKKLEEVKEK